MTAKTVKPKTEQKKKEDRISPETLRKLIDAKLLSRGIGTPEEATDEQLYRAVVAVVKDIMNKDRTDFISVVRTLFRTVPFSILSAPGLPAPTRYGWSLISPVGSAGSH